jgi:hypothetical protein
MNHFKDNSRFSSLIETSSNDTKRIFGKQNKPKTNKNNELDIKKEESNPIIEEKQKNNELNTFKNDKPVFQRDNNPRRPYNRDREREREFYEKQEKNRIVEEIKKKEEEKLAALNMDNFPELVMNSKKIMIVENTSNFLEKLKTNAQVDSSNKHVVKPGWVELCRDEISNTTIITSGVMKTEQPYIKTPQDLAYEILDHLAYLHEKRNNEYIQSWGQDEWDNMFLFPNYDYHYFEKLDEIYEKNNPEFNEDYEYGYYEEEDDEYWKRY